MTPADLLTQPLYLILPGVGAMLIAALSAALGVAILVHFLGQAADAA